MRARSLNICLLRDGNGPALARLAESELAVALGEDRVVLADSGTRTRAKARTPLADDDHSCLHDLPAEQLDLDLRELGAETRMPAVALLGLVLPDPDLRAERRADHLRRHLDARREVRLAVAAREEDVRMKRLALVGR